MCPRTRHRERCLDSEPGSASHGGQGVRMPCANRPQRSRRDSGGCRSRHRPGPRLLPRRMAAGCRWTRRRRRPGDRGQRLELGSGRGVGAHREAAGPHHHPRSAEMDPVDKTVFKNRTESTGRTPWVRSQGNSQTPGGAVVNLPLPRPVSARQDTLAGPAALRPARRRPGQRDISTAATRHQRGNRPSTRRGRDREVNPGVDVGRAPRGNEKP